MRTAILDLGTNTFNLLIIETETEDRKNIILSRKEPVKLGDSGITKGVISNKAFERGITAIESHMKYIKDYRVEQIHAFATSAIRTAGNGLEFVRTVYQKFNIGIQVISGDQEAGLVYQGVKQAVDMGNRKHLILDIGGGSNELIIANGKKIFWKKSYPLGVARLLEQFKPADPVGKDDILALENHFRKSMSCFFEAAGEHHPEILIGSSGSFDTFRALLTAIKTKPRANDIPLQGAPGDRATLAPSYRIRPSDFLRLHRKLLVSDARERLSMEGMEPMRVEMIVIASIFVNFIVRELNIGQLIQSEYALKEGAVAGIINMHVQSA
ncbi:MAG: hypothetical protein R6U58_06560 [Bacteroidales bacterium]